MSVATLMKNESINQLIERAVSGGAIDAEQSGRGRTGAHTANTKADLD